MFWGDNVFVLHVYCNTEFYFYFGGICIMYYSWHFSALNGQHACESNTCIFAFVIQSIMITLFNLGINK